MNTGLKVCECRLNYYDNEEG